MLRLFVVVIAFICCEAVPASYGQSSNIGSFASILKGGLSSLSNHRNVPIGASHSPLPLNNAVLTHRSGYATNSGLGYGGGAALGYGAGSTLGYGAPAAWAGPALGLAGPQVIDVAGDGEPVQVIFRSLGARVHVQQVHTPSGPPQIEQHRTEEEPHRVLHEIVRPVIQEVREVIQPYRRVTQEIRPVLEEVHTVVAKSDHGANGLAGAGLAGAGLAGVGLAGHDAGHYRSSRKA